MVPADSRRISRVPRYSGYRYVLSGFEYGIITLCDSSFQRILLTIKSTITRSYNTAVALPQQRFGLFPVRSPLLRESFFYFLLLGVLRCFSSPGSPHCHCSDTCPSDRWVVPFGNPRINGYLHLHAAYHVLHRLCEPRHPPCALHYFLDQMPSIHPTLNSCQKKSRTDMLNNIMLILSAVISELVSY